MQLRWFKKYSVIAQPNRTGNMRKVLIQDKVLQVSEKGTWIDIPIVNDDEGYRQAQDMMRAKAPLSEDKLAHLERDMEEVAEDLSESDDHL